MAIQFGSTAVNAIKYCNASGVLQDVTSVVRNGATVLEPQEQADYLTFTAKRDRSVINVNYYKGTDVLYRINNGEWVECYKGTEIELSSVGDIVQIKGVGVITTGAKHFSISGEVEGSGSVTSLTDSIGIDEDVVLSKNCYASMFEGCSGLISAPKLPAKTLVHGCYSYMFKDCSSLVNAPVLPAVSLSTSCYLYMFKDCSSLKISEGGGVGTVILNIPSGTVEPSDWNYYMFRGTGGSFTYDPLIGTAYYCYQ